MSYPRTLHVLIIEDDTDTVEAYRETFTSLATKFPLVTSYATSHEAAKSHLDRSEIFHAVILDLNLPVTTAGMPSDGLDPGEQLLEDLAKRDAYPVPVVLIVSGKLNLASSIGGLNDRLKNDFWYGRLVNKGFELAPEIEEGLNRALKYVDVGIHIRDAGKQWFPTLAPREEDLLRRCVLSDSSRLGVDVRWWSAEEGPSVSRPSPSTGPTKVLMGQFLMADGLGTSIPTFFKFEPVGNAPFVCRDIGILSQKLGHVKVFHTSQSRQRSLLVTQSATNRGVPIPLNEYLMRSPKEVGLKIGALIEQVALQLNQLGNATKAKLPIGDFFWRHLNREAMDRTWNTYPQAGNASEALRAYDALSMTTTRIWATKRHCNHGDLNATNIAIDADSPDDPQAYIFDAAGMQVDFELRDLATLEISTILFNANGTDDQLVQACQGMYRDSFLPSDLPHVPPGAALAQNVVSMIAAIRSRCKTIPEQTAYALLVFDAVLRQLSGLGIQPSPNKVRNPLHACALAETVARWLRVVAPVLFGGQPLPGGITDRSTSREIA